MARRLFRFDAPDRFVAGTVGAPGDRSFYLQARQGPAIVTLAVEKTQVAALATHIAEVVDGTRDAALHEPASGPDALELPIVEAFRVGALAMAWDAERGEMVIEAQPINEDGAYVEIGDAEAEGPDLFRVRLTMGAARGFARQALDLVQAGRPTCPFCGQPIDERGHLCPRSNPNLN
jgi:uncharacterized repeat protein (TIGR03847 family)